MKQEKTRKQCVTPLMEDCGNSCDIYAEDLLVVTILVLVLVVDPDLFPDLDVVRVVFVDVEPNRWRNMMTVHGNANPYTLAIQLISIQAKKHAALRKPCLECLTLIPPACPSRRELFLAAPLFFADGATSRPHRQLSEEGRCFFLREHPPLPITGCIPISLPSLSH